MRHPVPRPTAHPSSDHLPEPPAPELTDRLVASAER
ncbi:hypothetical protein SFUMM280S_08080 [Streptomyces fumanus]